MKLRKNALKLAGIAAVAAIIAGSVTGTLLVIEDEAWPARGGYEAIFQISLLFSGYVFMLALPVGMVLSVTLSPRMERAGSGPLAHVAVGLLIGLAMHLLVDLAIREPIDSWEDFLGGMLAGAAAGYLWWSAVQRHEPEVARDGR